MALALAERWRLDAWKERFRGRIAEGQVDLEVGGELGGGGARVPARARAAILCPQTFMNEAGRSVGPARGALRVELGRVLVVHDEIDLPFGEVRSRTGGGLAGHNGLRSVRRELGSADFSRVRVGVGRPDSSDPEIVSAYVLGRFREPPEQVQALIARSCDEVERLVREAALAN